MPSDYYLDGIAKATAEVREWVRVAFPITPPELRDKKFVPEKLRRKLVTQTLRVKAAAKARISVQWRNRMASALNIEPHLVTDAVSIILRDLEQQLARDNHVVVANFGTFKLDWTDKGAKVSFIQDEHWRQLMNPPKTVEDLGFNYRILPSGEIAPKRTRTHR